MTYQPDCQVMRPHPIDELISDSLRRRLAQLDPLLNLDRVARVIAADRRRRAAVRGR